MDHDINHIVQNLQKNYFELYPAEVAKMLNDLPAGDILELLELESIAVADRIFGYLNPEVAAELIKKMSDDYFTKLITKVDPGISAKIIGRLDSAEKKDRLKLLPAVLSREISELMSYPPETAGYLMDLDFSVFYPDETVESTLTRIRTLGDRRINNIHIMNVDNQLLGVIRLQDVAVSLPETLLSSLISGTPVAVQAFSPKEDIIKLFEDKNLVTLPVVDINGKLLGVIRYDALVTAVRQDATEDVQAMFGAGRDERALSSAFFSIRKRLPWLQINLVTAFLAASVVGMFEETIARVTVLAVFLPVVAGQSGNTGSQALAVTIRGLALREIRIRHWFRVARKEITVGFVNGVAVAFSTSLVVYFWTDSSALAMIIGVAMVFSMVIAGFSGAVIPILLTTIKQDPAQSSSIILTTVTDIVGFISFLGLATLLASAI